jgi:hypothetical protein
MPSMVGMNATHFVTVDGNDRHPHFFSTVAFGGSLQSAQRAEAVAVIEATASVGRPALRAVAS